MLYIFLKHKSYTLSNYTVLSLMIGSASEVLRFIQIKIPFLKLSKLKNTNLNSTSVAWLLFCDVILSDEIGIKTGRKCHCVLSRL